MLENGHRPLDIRVSYTTQENRDNWLWPNMISYAYDAETCFKFLKEMGVKFTTTEPCFLNNQAVYRFLDDRGNRLAAERVTAEKATAEKAGA